jgi:hypothetical protein
MQIITLIIAIFAALVLGCPPPLNSFDFLGNETHTIAELIDAAANQRGVGWTEVVTIGGT